MIFSIVVLLLAAHAVQDEKEIIALEANRRQALITGDTTSLSSILADDFREIAGNGNVRTKAQNLAAVRKVRWEEITASEEEVRFFRKVAVYTARGHNKGSLRGYPFDREFRFTRIYVRRHGRWQCVAAQYTPIFRMWRSRLRPETFQRTRRSRGDHTFRRSQCI
jgi:hypothetical protein